MKLHEMKPTPGSRHKKKRVGRGDKTAGRGENGQKSRAGYSRKIGFEGGQNPLYRRIPKRGFKNINSKFYKPINLSDLESINAKVINSEILIENNIIKKSDKLYKILGKGKLTKPVDVHAWAFSSSAKKAIEENGGKAIIIEKPVRTGKKDNK